MARFVVYGATGAVGRPLTDILARRGHTVVAPLRRRPDRPLAPSVVPNVIGLTDEDELRRVSRAADGVFILVGSNPAQVQIEQRYIDAAVAAGVPRIVKLSAPDLPGQPDMLVAGWHRQIEHYLAQTGVEHSSIQPMAFHQNWLRNTVTIRRFNMISGSAGSAVRSYVDAADVAEVAANLLECRGDLPATVPVAGPEVFSYEGVADLISGVIGRAIRYTDLDPDRHYKVLVKRAHMPEWLAEHVVELDTLARTVPEQPSERIAALLGRPARTLEQFLISSAHAFDKTPWHAIATRRLKRRPAINAAAGEPQHPDVTPVELMSPQPASQDPCRSAPPPQ